MAKEPKKNNKKEVKTDASKVSEEIKSSWS